LFLQRDTVEKLAHAGEKWKANCFKKDKSRLELLASKIVFPKIFSTAKRTTNYSTTTTTKATIDGMTPWDSFTVYLSLY
jgi:hypothetical protein